MSDPSLTPGHQLALNFGIVKQIGLECRQDGRQHISRQALAILGDTAEAI
jgi:hypothetical protein